MKPFTQLILLNWWTRSHFEVFVSYYFLFFFLICFVEVTHVYCILLCVEVHYR